VIYYKSHTNQRYILVVSTTQFEMTTLETISQLVDALFGAYTTDVGSSDTLREIVKRIEMPFAITNDMFRILSSTFVRIGQVLNVQFDVVVSDGKKMEMKQTSLFEMLSTIRKTHYHRDGEFVCNFHQESLFVHLHLATMIAMMKKIGDGQLEDVFFIGVTALLHDIGKPACMKKIQEKMWLGYPFHGEMGSMILSQIYNEGFAVHFTREQWSEMCRMIQVHMCGYHSTDPVSKSAQYKWELLRLENSVVKRNLVALSYGDHFGAIPDDSVAKGDMQEWIESRAPFQQIIDLAYDHTAFRNAYRKNQSVLLYVRGPSASGKSTFVQNLIAHLNGMGVSFVYVERDMVVCQVAGEAVKEEVDTRPTGETYSRLRKIYDEKKLGKVVNDRIKKMISDGLNAGKVVIVDSLITYYAAIDYVLPNEVKSTFILAVDVVRNTLLADDTGDRIGVAFGKQIEIHGDRSEFCPIPSNIADRFNAMTTISTILDLGDDRFKTDAPSVPRPSRDAQPHLSHTIAWNAYGTIGDREFYRQLEQIVTASDGSATTSVASKTLVEYANDLYRRVGWDEMLETFEKNGFLARPPHAVKGTPYEKRVVCIKYIDTNRCWEKWARQCRGTVLYLNDSDRLVPIKFMMERGAEILTNMHVKQKIDETQDIVSVRDLSIFDSVQQETMNLLLDNKPISGVMTGKVDGSLCAVTIYRGDSAFVRNWVYKYGDELAKTFQYLANQAGLNAGLCVSSQTTLWLGLDMQDYMVTSILTSLGIVAYFDLQEMAKTMTPAEVMKMHGKEFIERIKELSALVKGDIVTFNFEAVCKNRMSAWGRLHTELAVCYSQSLFRFLGVGVCTNNSVSYLPHFTIAQNVFDEPLFWEITESTEIEAMLIDLSSCIRGTMTREEYFVKHPYGNAKPSSTEFDYEGFVFFRRVVDTYDYNKIKTSEYYMGHKFRLGNVLSLVELAKTASNIFPLCKVVQEFFGLLCMNLCTAMSHTVILLEEETATNQFFAGMLEKAKVSFMKQNRETQYKMLICASSTANKVLLEVFSEMFPSLTTSVTDKTEIAGTLRCIMTTIKPWQEGAKERIEVLIEKNDQLLLDLFSHCNQSVTMNE